jgi:hypothetical protein
MRSAAQKMLGDKPQILKNQLVFERRTLYVRPGASHA